MRPEICLIEDDPILGETLRDRLVMEGFDCVWCQGGQEALARLQAHDFHGVVSDIRLPDVGGLDIYRTLLERPGKGPPPTLFITAYGTIDEAVQALKEGAVDYVTKPLDPDLLVDKLRAACSFPAADALGMSPALGALEGQLHALSHHRQTPVLVTGESGCGKEVLARRLHTLDDPPGRFVALNCAAVPEHLIEAELFGHEKGAFTGAGRTRKGIFEQAEGGTLFLDEIGDMPPAMQAKLLRVLQERAITRVGGDYIITVDARLVLATHRDLRTEVAAGRFREDLYYRINVVNLHVPPLRERPEDILWLAGHFLDEFNRRFPERRKTLAEGACKALTAHGWPGNVRELRHAIERACILGGSPVIEAHDVLPPDGAAGIETKGRLATAVSRAERERILAVLEDTQWRITASAEVLGISRKSLWQKMKAYDIRKP
ncbi:MAG: sigma-54 dependent transcriptional regulator [Gammaproteobacteria bacterium]|nr:sigma-54 dependent transcriptional regulator [Gammaproteobacteria bacterium]